MNKKELAQAVAHVLNTTEADGKRALEAVLKVIHDTVAAGEKVSILGHGVYEKVTRPARTARNPATGESMHVDESTVPKFRAGADFKNKVAGQ